MKKTKLIQLALVIILISCSGREHAPVIERKIFNRTCLGICDYNYYSSTSGLSGGFFEDSCNLYHVGDTLNGLRK